MSDTIRTVSFAELADRLGAGAPSASGGRHRAVRSTGVGRIVAGAVAGAALSGGAAMAAAPVASAQSAEIPSPEQLGQMAGDAAQQMGITEDQIRDYAGDPALGARGAPGDPRAAAPASRRLAASMQTI